jgi:hypothetical protein
VAFTTPLPKALCFLAARTTWRSRSLNKLPVDKILLGAFTIPWHDRPTYIQSLLVPAVFLVTVQLVWWYVYLNDSQLLGWQLWALYWLAFSIFAVVCHRIALLPPFSRSLAHSKESALKVLKFLGYLLLVGLLTGTLASSIGALISTILAALLGTQNISEAMRWASFVAFIPASYLPARLSMVFPAIAIDSDLSLRDSFELTQGNGWRLVVIVGLLPWALTSSVEALAYDGMSIVEVFLWCFVSAALTVIEVIALSLSFWELGKGNSIERTKT